MKNEQQFIEAYLAASPSATANDCDRAVALFRSESARYGPKILAVADMLISQAATLAALKKLNLPTESNARKDAIKSHVAAILVILDDLTGDPGAPDKLERDFLAFTRRAELIAAGNSQADAKKQIRRDFPDLKNENTYSKAMSRGRRLVGACSGFFRTEPGHSEVIGFPSSMQVTSRRRNARRK